MISRNVCGEVAKPSPVIINELKKSLKGYAQRDPHRTSTVGTEKKIVVMIMMIFYLFFPHSEQFSLFSK